MAILGLDIGTTGSKATVFSDTGSILGHAYQEYPTESPQNGWFELDSRKVWRAVQNVLRKACSDSAEEVQCICISSLGEAFVCLDENGTELYGSMLYMDERGDEECEEISSWIGTERLIQKTGHAPNRMYTLSKLLWLKKHQPEKYKKVRYIHFFGDYILFKLTGEHVTDYSLAARSMCFNIVQKQWDREILDASGLAEHIFPSPMVAGSIVGQVLPSVAAETGLREKTLAVLGAHDQIMCAVGAGVLFSGEAVNSIGTVDCVTPVFTGAKLTDEMIRCGYACVPYLFDNSYVTYAFTMTGGSLLRWFRDTFARLDKQEATKRGCNIYELLEKTMPKEPTNIFVLPHFAGSPMPDQDEKAKGAILNLSFNSGREDIFRACLEGETFEIKNNLLRLEQNGIGIQSLRTVGGGSRSDPFMQIRADILGIPVMTMECEEAGTLGTAILAGVATDLFPSVEAACASLVRVKKVFKPNTKRHEIYQKQFEKYMKLYGLLKAVR